jgi:hypothetical protein
MSIGNTPQLEQTAQEAEYQQIGNDKWNEYKERYQPHDATAIERASNKDRMRTVGNDMTAAAGGRAFSEATSAVKKNAASRGVNPNSGGFTANINNVLRKSGESISAGEVVSNAQADERFAGGALNVLNRFNNMESSGIQSIGESARMADSVQRQNAQTEMDSNTAMVSAAGQIAGATAGYYGGKKGDKPKKEGWGAAPRIGGEYEPLSNFKSFNVR